MRLGLCMQSQGNNSQQNDFQVELLDDAFALFQLISFPSIAISLGCNLQFFFGSLDELSFHQNLWNRIDVGD